MAKVAIIAGWGAYNSGLEEYATRHNIPVLLTWRAMDLLPEDSPLYCGRPGGIGQPVANWILQNCDTLLVLGARLDPESIAYNPKDFAPQAEKIIVDVDEAEINKHLFPHASACKTVADYLKTCDIEGDWEWLQKCRALYEKYQVIRPDHLETKNYYSFVNKLSELARDDDVIGYGSSGIGVQVLMQSWKVKRGQRVCNSSTMGAMGSWIGAVGLAKASGKRVLCVVGDGGFSINTPELEVIRRDHLPIKIFVFCNGGYGSIKATGRRFFDGRDITGGFQPIIKGQQIGDIFGVELTHIYNLNDLGSIMDNDDPVVATIDMPPDQTPDYRCNGNLIEMDHMPEELCQTMKT